MEGQESNSEEDESYSLDEDNDGNIHIRPPSRISNRRHAVRPVPIRRNTLAYCSECFNSIYEGDLNYNCHTCKCIYCKICWDNNSHCVKCTWKLNKNDGNITTKINQKSCSNILRKFIVCICCLEKKN